MNPVYIAVVALGVITLVTLYAAWTRHWTPARLTPNANWRPINGRQTYMDDNGFVYAVVVSVNGGWTVVTPDGALKIGGVFPDEVSAIEAYIAAGQRG